MSITVRAANALDVLYLCADMRADDVMELQAAVGDLPPIFIVASGAAKSEEAYVCTIDDRILAMWGVNRIEGTALTARRGWGWLLTTNLVDKYPKLFSTLARAELRKLLDRWSSLENYVDVRHEKAVRWGKSLGFIFDEPAPFGVSGLPAQHFVVTKESFDVRTSRHTNRRRRARERSGGRRARKR